MTGTRTPAALLCATLLLTGCGGASTTAGETDRPEEPPVSSEQPPAGAKNAAARASVADLAGRLGVAEDAVTVVATEEVTWRDGSLGCAEEGSMYTQALVDGSRITLEAEGKRYEYHSGGSRDPFLCEDPTQ